MNILNMTVASAATPYYFTPAIIDDVKYISGDNLAFSPAMFTMFYSMEVFDFTRNGII